jgi:hypothetical protein
MSDEEQLIQELGIEQFTQEEIENVLDEYRVQVGEALSKDLSDEQLQEFESIINDDRDVIDGWLQANEPDYVSNPAFIEIEKGLEGNDEGVSAEKAYATIAWTKANNPGIAEAITLVKAHIKAHADQYKN